MTMTYTWKITELKTTNTSDLQEVVVQTRWEKTGTDENGNTGTFIGATPFTPTSVSPESFVPFNQLTEETVLQWIKGVVVGQYADHVDTQIAKQIIAKSVQTPPLPWAELNPSKEPASI